MNVVRLACLEGKFRSFFRYRTRTIMNELTYVPSTAAMSLCVSTHRQIYAFYFLHSQNIRNKIWETSIHPSNCIGNMNDVIVNEWMNGFSSSSNSSIFECERFLHVGYRFIELCIAYQISKLHTLYEKSASASNSEKAGKEMEKAREWKRKRKRNNEVLSTERNNFVQKNQLTFVVVFAPPIHILLLNLVADKNTDSVIMKRHARQKNVCIFRWCFHFLFGTFTVQREREKERHIQNTQAKR